MRGRAAPPQPGIYRVPPPPGFDHTNLNQDIFETAYFFLHESALRPHENKFGSTKTRIVMKPLSKAVLSPRPQKRKNTCGLIYRKCPNSCVNGL